MKKKLLLVLFIATLLLAGCSGGGLSKEAKALYNEQMGYYIQSAEAMKQIVESDTPVFASTFSTGFFHLNEAERKVWDGADFGEEMQGYLTKGKGIDDDYKILSEANTDYTLFAKTKEEKDVAAQKYVELFNQMKTKYEGFDFTLKTYE